MPAIDPDARPQTVHGRCGLRVRSVEIILILLSILVIALAGFAPLFNNNEQRDVVRRECEMFYGPSGLEAVEHCLSEMTQRASRRAR